MAAQKITIREGIVGALLDVCDTISDAQRDLEAYAQETRTVAAPMPVLLQGFPHYQRWMTPNSEEYSGTDVDGTFGYKGGCVVATRHGGKEGKWGLFTPDIIQTVLDMHKRGHGGINLVHAAVLSDLYKGDVIRDMLHGGMPDGRTIVVFSYEQLVAGECPRDGSEYVVVRPFSLARKTDSGHNPIARLVDANGNVIDSQVISYAGGVQDAQDVIENAKQKFPSGYLGVFHPFNLGNFNPTQSQGRVLLVDHGGGGLYGRKNICSDGCFVAVAPEALVGVERQSHLEEMVNVTLPRHVADAMKAGNDFTFEGKQYILKPQQ